MEGTRLESGVDVERDADCKKCSQHVRSIRMADLPVSVAEELEVLDVDESGTLSISEIIESVRMYRESKRQYGIAMKTILALCVFALIQVAAIVGTVWALLVKVKDTETSSNDGKVMLTDKGNGRLVHTGIASHDYPLELDLEDAVLQQAERLSLRSATGNLASFDVAGYVRYREGEEKKLSIVFHAVGGVTLTEQGYSFTDSVGNLLADAGFPLSNKTTEAGRKLKSGTGNSISSMVTSTYLGGVSISSASPVPPTPLFYLASNGITVMCPEANFGFTGAVGGIEYMKRSWEELTALILADPSDERIGRTCTSGITDMEELFQNCNDFNQDISSWDTGQVADMRRMFEEATRFNQDIGSWDTSQVVYMDQMFAFATSFNQDIGSWDTSQAKSMFKMFNVALSFHQDISGWCVEKIKTQPEQFDNVSGFEGQAALQPSWGQPCTSA